MVSLHRITSSLERGAPTSRSVAFPPVVNIKVVKSGPESHSAYLEYFDSIGTSFPPLSGSHRCGAVGARGQSAPCTRRWRPARWRASSSPAARRAWPYCSPRY